MKTKLIFTAIFAALALIVAGSAAGARAAQLAVGNALGVNVTTSTHASTSASSGVMVNTNAVVNTNANVNATTDGTVSTMSGSGSVTDVDVVAQSLVSGDASVSSVNTTSNNQVSVEYKRPAKLFGFINVNLTETATVKTDASGKAWASVHKSWWSAFASTKAKTADFQTALSSRVSSEAANTSGSAELSASAKARYLSDINAAASATYNN